MIIILVFGIAALFIGLWTGQGVGEKVWHGVFSGGIVAGFAFALSLVTGLIFYDVEVKTGHIPIEAIKDNTHTDGDFYLFGGSVDSEPVYSYYYKTDQGIRMGWAPARKSWIIEEETDNPRMVIEKEESRMEPFGYVMATEDNTKYIFYVPPGTVTREFELDLE